MRHSPGREPEPAGAVSLLDAGRYSELRQRDRLLVWGCMLVIAALAWGYLIHLHRSMAPAADHAAMMAGMGMAMPWTAADGLYTFAMWVVMMIGMMAPAAAPVMLIYAGLQRRRQGKRLPATVVCFGLGYLAVWVGFSAAITLVQWGLHETMLLSPAMAISSRVAGGAILSLAGLYQLTPWKRACLTHCRSPLGFLMTNWRDGKRGALTMGIRHGAFCLGCCWALMAVLFVTGVMALLWVTALALLVLLEKAGPAGLQVARLSGIVLIAAGVLLIWLAVAPSTA
ncbi:DUF2182 domain-containing protein [Cupriavidus sp. UGS-1]|uniref:DUF2182 domain-containing protein n=1 Tax=Cupriavidus sp. UGS-1 TaxID=2899826 RepID=UPI001E447A73|nr:DUF2182 domain-containing protein [Cupriavidus sp. UGS-1]MCD9120548.1 DUF2182 domain-containing protein [Cupriavidus sp. UGS-1]